MPGPPPKASRLKILTGNPGKRPIDSTSPEAARGRPRKPPDLDAEAKAEWLRVVKLLEAESRLTVDLGPVLTGYVTSWSRWRAAEKMLQQFGPIMVSKAEGMYQSPYLSVANRAMNETLTFLRELGLTPSSRVRLVKRETETADPMGDLLDGRASDAI